MADSLKVALAQTSSAPGDVAANAALAAEVIGSAHGAQLVVFPELFLSGYDLAVLAAKPGAWIQEADPRLEPVRRACRLTGATAVLGGALRRDGRALITAPVIGPAGDVCLCEKKYIHGSEKTIFSPGEPGTPFDVGGFRVSVGICFDAAHPRHAEYATALGADVYVVSALYTVGEERRVDLHLGARAMDNRVFSVLSNHAGKTGDHVSLGGSGAWSPTGAVLQRLSDATAGVLTVDLSRAELDRFRSGHQGAPPRPPAGLERHQPRAHS